MQALDVENDYRWHVLEHYNRHAYFYDLMEFIRRGTRRKAMVLSGWRPGESVLDLCTGTGELALTFASQGAKVVGTDIARGMLKRAVTKSSNLGSTWIEMDATDLAFAENSFEISVLSLALHHMPIAVQLRVLKELRRVTTRRIVIIEPRTPTDPRWFTLWAGVASLIDESEYIQEWVHQDFTNTCYTAHLQVESVHVTSLGLHRIVLCDPEIREPGNQSGIVCGSKLAEPTGVL
ncbi:MAG TPA: methyltransferase domain-containing protein [Anaerolineales bacterium]|nr:methyltransferase domain-containing protein [Anaerolineales bacterium]HLO27572.1 methyltransferase domain-containing protein [Anaerolineales bacterium]